MSCAFDADYYCIDLSEAAGQKGGYLAVFLAHGACGAGFQDLAWSPTTDPALIDYEERQMHRNTLFMMQALMTQSTRPDPSGFSALTLPIDIIAGADDRLTPPSGAEALAALLPQASFHLIEKSGHQILLGQWDIVTRLLFERIGSL